MYNADNVTNCDNIDSNVSNMHFCLLSASCFQPDYVAAYLFSWPVFCTAMSTIFALYVPDLCGKLSISQWLDKFEFVSSPFMSEIETEDNKHDPKWNASSYIALKQVS